MKDSHEDPQQQQTSPESFKMVVELEDGLDTSCMSTDGGDGDGLDGDGADGL
jgi:hypothetical protein